VSIHPRLVVDPPVRGGDDSAIRLEKRLLTVKHRAVCRHPGFRQRYPEAFLSLRL